MYTKHKIKSMPRKELLVKRKREMLDGFVGNPMQTDT